MDLELWERVRRKVLVEGQAKRRVMREEGLAWGTLRKILAHSAPPGYRQKKERPKRKLGEHWDWMATGVVRGQAGAPQAAAYGEKALGPA